MFVLFGNSVNCQVFLSMDSSVVSSPRGDYLSVNFGWATGVAVGVWVCAGVSGGHINPSVTIALATFRGFPWKKVPAYILAQLLGGICGAGITYANYFHAINAVEGGRNIRTIAKTGDLFATYPLSILTPVSCFSDEFMGSAVLIISILAVTDKRNAAPPAGLLPVALFIIVLGIGAAMGMNTSYALNPARDLGPRILTVLVGYGTEVFAFKNQYWLWCPLLGSVLGMLFGTLTYDALIYTGGDSIVNKPWVLKRRAKH
ncbi:aquaporin [Boletus coccyginus]|nr:aquaporin [Boletus coccyginus]